MHWLLAVVVQLDVGKTGLANVWSGRRHTAPDLLVMDEDACRFMPGSENRENGTGI